MVCMARKALSAAVVNVFMLLLMCVCPPASAQSWDTAIGAYNRGDFERAFSEFWSLAGRGHEGAQYGLGEIYYFGLGVREDRAAAARWYRLAAEQGHAEAQFSLGLLYDLGDGVREDNVAAAYWYRLAADQGDADAQFSLGLLYDLGEGVREDDEAAARWYRFAANQGHARAQFAIGLLYDLGKGVWEDDAAAARWYRLAADQGDAEAQFGLGLLYDLGDGVREDNVAAARWYRFAADQGHAIAQFNLGLMYDFGEGVREDPLAATRWYRLAADQGDSDAQFLLGQHYEIGNGVPKNLITAYAWYALAAATASTHHNPSSLMHEFGEIESSRRRVAGRLSLEERSRALDMARQWLSAAPTSDLPSQFDYNDASSRDAVRDAQRALAQLGYFAGTIDGVLGPYTREAIRSFQSDAGLPVDGAVSEQLESALVVAVRLFAADAARTRPVALERTGSGSGFRVSSDGHVLTNDHVVNGCAEVRIPPYGTVSVSARDEVSDLAILMAPGGGVVAAFRQGAGVQQGAEVLAAGFPLHGILASGVHVTVGTVSALAGPGNDRRQFQFTAAVQPGNSGGPVVDTSGNAVGVVVSRLNQSEFAGTASINLQTVNFAVSAGTARAFLDSEGVAYVTAPSNVNLRREEVAAAARAFTVLIECWN